jgi:DNA-binding beta-propeller fold protein YncE
MNKYHPKHTRVSVPSFLLGSWSDQVRKSRLWCGGSLAVAVVTMVGLLSTASPASAAAPEPLWQAPASAELGSASGRLDHPEGVAANKSTGNVYVADVGNNRVDEFGAWGEFVEAWGWGVADGKNELQICGPGANPPIAECQRGTAGSGAGQFGVGGFEKMRGGVAVDSAGDVYVGDITNHRVEKFDATGKFLLMFGGEVDKGTHHPGNVCTVAYIAEGDVCGAGVAGGGEGQFETTGYGNYIAVGPTGTIYVGDKGRMQEFESDGAFKSQIVLEGQFATKTVQALAVDAAGNLYLTLSVGGAAAPEPYILKLSPTGSLLDTYIFAAGEVPVALAPDAAGDLYAVVEKEQFSHREIIEFGPNGDSIIPVGAGFAVSAGGADTGHPLLTSLATNVVTDEGGTDLYVTATDTSAKSYVGAYGTPPLNWPPPHHPPEIAAQYALSVEPTSATLGAQINPRFWPDTSYYVEYGPGRCVESECSLRQPTLASVELGAGAVGDASATRNVLLSGLAPGTTYHYRFVAASSGGGPIYGVGSDEAEATFITPELPTRPDQSCPNETLRTAASAALPDCRAYEMVTPIEKNNSDIVTLINVNSNQVALDESAVSGEKLTYTTSQAFGDAQGAPYSSQYIASRGSGGWTSHDITPPQGFSAVQIGHRIDLEFRAFTEDLCDGVVLNAMTPLLAPGATEGFYNLYRRTNCQTEGYETLTSASPPPAPETFYEPTVQGTSSDGSCTVFRATAPLTPEADPGNDSQVYESCNGHLALVSILPSRKANSSGSSAGTYDGVGLAPRVGTVMHSVSADGSRVYWTASDSGPGKLYVRINTMREQSKVSAGKCTEPEKACTITISTELAHFWSASKDGATAFYTSNGELFQSSLEAGRANSTPLAGEVTGVVGASEDANRIYFLSEEALTGANTEGKQPHVGAPNLYLFDSTRDVSDRYRFIGTLSAEDAVLRSNGALSPVNLESYKKDSRVSPDGLDVVFMSKAGLTGYDNIDAHSGQADGEIFVYDATADEGAGRLDCVSCNPTGQRPAGHEIPIEGFESGGWAAALLPPYETELYGSRVASDDGTRVFFDAYEALVPHDTNGVEDVYEWEAQGAGSCTSESAVFSVLDGGCVSLISSGESPTPSEFVDASPSGSNVFFTTASSLVAQDPGLIDIYDARVDGGFPPIPGLPSICEGEACQGAPSPPLDTSPASASFSGPGDTSSTAPVTKVSPKRMTPAQMLAQKLAKALKVCGKQPKRNRKRCQATVRRRYAAKSKVENDRKPNTGGKQ